MLLGYLRAITTRDLESPYDEAVAMATAYLVAGELERRRLGDDTQLTEMEFDHAAGKFTSSEQAAHSIIQSYLRGNIVLRQSASDRDVTRPDVAPASGNGSVGKIEAYLPHEYQSNKADTWILKCTTAGRVADSTAKFSVFLNYGATAVSTDVTASDSQTHLGNELYVRFRDMALTANSFDVNDEWTIKAYPSSSETRTGGIRELNFYES